MNKVTKPNLYQRNKLITILTVIFVILKLVGVTTMSWWWVFSPYWIMAIFRLAAFALAGYFMSKQLNKFNKRGK